MPNQIKAQKRSSYLLCDTEEDDSNDSIVDDAEVAPSEQSAEPQRHVSPIIGLLIVAIISALATGPSTAIGLIRGSKGHSPFEDEDTRSLNDGDDDETFLDAADSSTQSCATDPPPTKFIAIRGERHSTTNLFREVTNRNGRFQESCGLLNKYVKRCDEVLGWKHGFFNPERDVVGEDLVVAVLVRDVFSWLVSMFNEPYNMIMDEGTDHFGIFLKSYYIANGCEVRDYYEGCTYPIETAENLVQLRTRKYKNWVDFLSNGNNATKSQQNRWSIVNSEKLVADQERTVKSFFEQHCIETARPTFEPVGKIVTHSKQSNHAGREDILKKFTTDQLLFVLDNLDRDFESQVLGYDYSYVDDHIARRTGGKLNYAGPPVLEDKMLEKRLKLIEDNIEGKLPGRDISYEEAGQTILKDIQQFLWPVHAGNEDSD